MRIITLIPLVPNVGLQTILRGLIEKLHTLKVKAVPMHPIWPHAQTTNKDIDKQLQDFNTPIPEELAEKLIGTGQQEKLLEYCVSYAYRHKQADILIVPGMTHGQRNSYATEFNIALTKALNAQAIFVTTKSKHLTEELHIAMQSLKEHAAGFIINKLGSPNDEMGHDYPQEILKKELIACNKLKIGKLLNLGTIPWSRDLSSPRVSDIQEHLKAKVLNDHKLKQHRATHFIIAGASVDHAIRSFKDNTLVITPIDRVDIILAAQLAVRNGTQLSGLLLTGGYDIPQALTDLCKKKPPFPILSVQTDTLRTVIHLQEMNTQIPPDDTERKQKANTLVEKFLQTKSLRALLKTTPPKSLTPYLFRHQLREKAHKAQKTIVLPEGEEPRIIQAAIECTQQSIAKCILLGNKTTIQKIAKQHKLTLPKDLTILNPSTLKRQYTQTLVQLRKHKGMTKEKATKALQNPILIGTLMVHTGKADGLVAGAITTTADTIRPALQILKTRKGVKLVSSIFFMCLPEQVLIYGDCAINPNPTVEQLVDIAQQSAHSAKQFGIEPKVAMISYSTGTSGSGEDVALVQEATKLLHQKNPSYPIDGPLQYDAASNKKVAKTKAPKSKVAGEATVFIFPDLNTANTTYKAVQRSAHILSIGPMLQGLSKPVNDLSRGASVEDIIYTIAITAIQSTK